MHRDAEWPGLVILSQSLKKNDIFAQSDSRKNQLHFLRRKHPGTQNERREARQETDRRHVNRVAVHSWLSTALPATTIIYTSLGPRRFQFRLEGEKNGLDCQLWPRIYLPAEHAIVRTLRN